MFAAHRQRYGTPRITEALHDEGITCSKNRVARRMGVMGLEAIQTKKFKVTTDSAHAKPVAPNRLEQDFHATAPNRKWTSDITSVWTDEGVVVSRRGDGPLRTSHRRVVDAPPDDTTIGV